MKDLETETALDMAHAIADLIQAADESALRDPTIRTAAWCIVELLDVVQADNEERHLAFMQKCEALQQADEEARLHHEHVTTYLNPKTSPETRAELAPLIQAGDIADELERIAGIQQHISEYADHLSDEKQLAEQLLTHHKSQELEGTTQSRAARVKS
jgi:hypothetical protein